MTEPLQDSKNHAAADDAVSAFVSRLSDQQRMLIVLKSKLYDGRWDAMLDDLKNRLAGKPYIFKLVNRIKDDIESIELLQAFEQEHKIDLADFVELGG
jgi:hypothetical protein